MPFIDVSDDDISKDKAYNTLFPPDWYRVRVNRTDQSLSKNGDSTNFTINGTVLFNATNGNEDLKGLPTPYWNFNSKGAGFAVGFFRALGVDVKAGRMDFAIADGKELDVFISNESYENKMRNRINHQYRAPRVLA